MKVSDKPATSFSVGIDVESSSLDEAIEKANRLVELLREAASIIDSLSIGVRLES